METQTLQVRKPPIPPNVVATGTGEPDDNYTGEVIAMIIAPIEYFFNVLCASEVVYVSQQKEKP